MATDHNFKVKNGLEVENGFLLIGKSAYSTSDAYMGIKTSNMSGANDYMMISGTGDNNTYISAKAGASVVIRSGGNTSTHQLTIGSGGAAFNGNVTVVGKASIAASTSTSSSNALKLHVGTINNTGSSAIAQFGGFIRASEYYILHETTGSSNSIFIDYVGNDFDIRAGEGSYTGVIRTNGYKVGTTTVIDSSRNLSNIGSISSGTITSTGVSEMIGRTLETYVQYFNTKTVS